MLNRYFSAAIFSAIGCSAASPTAEQGFEALPTEAGCPAAYLVSNSDYTSTNISVLSPTGDELSASFISSGSAPPGLTTALSGDVAFPSAAAASGQVVLIDRYPNSVLTWVDRSSAQVLQQLAVGTGFGANPHDYLELSSTKGYVSRYESNPRPGREPFDSGGDLLIIDPTANTITGSVELTTESDGIFLPRPDRLLAMGDQVWLLLHGFDKSFAAARDARLLAIDVENDSVVWTLELEGLTNCSGLTLSPSRKLLALSCTGALGGGTQSAVPESDVVLLDATTRPPTVIQQFGVAERLGAPLGSSLAFASETLLVGTAFGDIGAARNDLAFTLDTTTGAVDVLFDAGAAFALGDVRCAPSCSNLCFVADAQANALNVWEIERGTLVPRASVFTAVKIGLPPRALGAL